MEIIKNIFDFVNQIRSFNEKVEGFNKMLEQYFSLELSYFKNKYLFEKNFKANLKGAETYKKIKAKHEQITAQTEMLKQNQEYIEFNEKLKKINRKIDFYQQKLADDSLSKSKKEEIELDLKNTIKLKNKFKNIKNHKILQENIEKHEKEAQILEMHLNQNMHYGNIDASLEDDISRKIKNSYFKKEELFATIKEKNMPQEASRLSAIIQKVESAQKQHNSFASIMLDKRFELNKINYLDYLKDFKKNLFQITQSNETGLVEKYFLKISQKFSQEGFEKQIE